MPYLKQQAKKFYTSKRFFAVAILFNPRHWPPGASSIRNDQFELRIRSTSQMLQGWVSGVIFARICSAIGCSNSPSFVILYGLFFYFAVRLSIAKLEAAGITNERQGNEP